MTKRTATVELSEELATKLQGLQLDRWSSDTSSVQDKAGGFDLVNVTPVLRDDADGEAAPALNERAQEVWEAVQELLETVLGQL